MAAEVAILMVVGAAAEVVGIPMAEVVAVAINKSVYRISPHRFYKLGRQVPLVGIMGFKPIERLGV